ncbi:MAG: hypothetical protein HY481_02105 [Candidatus Vogelbacteria bacterium]|nr:hypothetical protein [Candidatus Vogelbacteria bacterium]
MDAARLREQILNFPKQLEAGLEVVNADRLIKTDKFILCGLGGSALAGGLMKVYNPELDLLIHRDYGLPRVPRYFLEGALLILSSYSGETEEVLDTLAAVMSRGLKAAVIAGGGTLLEEAKRLRLPYVVLPAGWLPRLAVGHSFTGLAKLIRDDKIIPGLALAREALNLTASESAGKKLSVWLDGKLTIIYASTVNLHLAYYWKICLNETGKTAAFFNVLPEMNHNELAAADPHFGYIFLRDTADHPRIKHRFDRLSEMFEGRGLAVTEVILSGRSPLEKIFHSVLLANWTAYHLALAAQRDPAATPVIEEFKKLIKSDV